VRGVGSGLALEMMLLVVLLLYFLCCLEIASGDVLICGFGNALRIWVYVSTLGVLMGSISNAGIRDNFEVVQLSGKRGGTEVL